MMTNAGRVKMPGDCVPFSAGWRYNPAEFDKYFGVYETVAHEGHNYKVSPLAPNLLGTRHLKDAEGVPLAIKDVHSDGEYVFAKPVGKPSKIAKLALKMLSE